MQLCLTYRIIELHDVFLFFVILSLKIKLFCYFKLLVSFDVLACIVYFLEFHVIYFYLKI